VDENGRRRIDEPDDFVALEIGAALKRGIVVMPVVVDGAEMVRSTQLPDAVTGLATRHAVTLDHATFTADAQNIIESIDRVLATAELRRGERASDARATSSAGSADTMDDIQALLLARVKRRKRLWWGIYALSYLVASGAASIVNPAAEDVGGAVLGTAASAGGLLWCIWGLRREIATQRLLVDQLPASAEIEPIRRAVSRRHVVLTSLICLVVALVLGILVQFSPHRPATTRTGALPASELEFGHERYLRQLPR
jgi:hypothetical protein